MLGREVTLPLGAVVGPPPGKREGGCTSEYVEWLGYTMEQAFDHARKCLNKSFQRQKKSYDQKQRGREYSVGDWVWRWYPPRANQKLGLGWTGPYLVIGKGGGTSVQIQKDSQAPKIMVHSNDLKPYVGKVALKSWLV